MLLVGGAVAVCSDGFDWILRSDPQMPVERHACLRCVLGYGVGQGTTHCLTVFVYWNGFWVLCVVPVCVFGGEEVVGSCLVCRVCFRVLRLPQSAFHHLRNPDGLRDGVMAYVD